MSPPGNITPRGGVAILLSTYNGARFLREQLDSLLGQSYAGWRLYWRDDGSTDETRRMMRDFAAKAGAGRCHKSASSGVHLGACASFLTLLAENPGAGAIAFADQDDVWLPEKLECALTELAQAGGRPALYCARQYLVDERLRGTKLSAAYSRAPSFPACLTQNIANGNTLVMNAAAAALVASAGRPEGSVHDWWSYIVVSACGGAVLFDERPQVLYRLHDCNAIGRAHSVAARAIAALQRGPGIYMAMMRRHADMLAAQPHRLTAQAQADLHLVRAGLNGGLPERLNALRCRRFRRRTLLENLLFWSWFITATATPRPALPAWPAAKPHSQPTQPL